mmetsp:Transcript_9541/g.17378  ORF Transcript_9541/g.17378 Transcript_9541/m.17378 type:complete len:248 (+) Transcript_9541:874-1617(+)
MDLAFAVVILDLRPLLEEVRTCFVSCDEKLRLSLFFFLRRGVSSGIFFGFRVLSFDFFRFEVASPDDMSLMMSRCATDFIFFVWIIADMRRLVELDLDRRISESVARLSGRVFLLFESFELDLDRRVSKSVARLSRRVFLVFESFELLCFGEDRSPSLSLSLSFFFFFPFNLESEFDLSNTKASNLDLASRLFPSKRPPVLMAIMDLLSSTFRKAVASNCFNLPLKSLFFFLRFGDPVTSLVPPRVG